MRNKKAKALKRIAVAMSMKAGKPFEAPQQYKKMKKVYKETKGER